MTDVVLNTDTGVAEGFYRVFKQAIDQGERIRLIPVGTEEEFGFANVTEAIFYKEGFFGSNADFYGGNAV